MRFWTTVKLWWNIATTDPDADDDDDDDEDEDEGPANIYLTSIFRYASPTDRFFLASAVLASLVNSTTSFAWTFILVTVSQIMTDFANSDTSTPARIEDARQLFQTQILRFVLVFMGLAVLYLFSGSLRVYLWTRVSERVALQLRNKFYDKVMRKDISWFENHSSGELVTHLTSHIDSIQTGVSDTLGVIMEGLFTFAIALIYSATVGWRLALPIIALTAFMVVIGTVAYRFAVRRLKRNLNAREKAGQVATEALTHIRTVKAFGGEQREQQKYAVHLKEIEKQHSQRGFILGLEQGVESFYSHAVYAFGIWYGFKLFLAGSITGAAVLQTLLLLLLGVDTLTEAISSMGDVHTATLAAARIFRIIEEDDNKIVLSDTPPLISASGSALMPTIEKSSAKSNSPLIEFKNVSFAYPSRRDVQVLDGFSLSIRKGQTVALVGSSGSGKSTIVSLLTRLYEAGSGDVLLGGVPIKQMAPKALRARFGVVSQEPVLFDTTIFQNVAWGAVDQDITLEQVQMACRQANVHEFITSLPNGYDTKVGEKGVLLSGGQKQRIAIARALISDPEILILDEATSALDTKSERVVQAAINKIMVGRTCVVIAHRLSTIINADQIVVMANGKILESGNHQTLLSNATGPYSALVKAQEMRKTDPATAKESTDEADEKETAQPEPRAESTDSEDADEIQVTADSSQKTWRFPLLRVIPFCRPNLVFLFVALFTSFLNGTLLPIFAGATSTMFSVFNVAPDPANQGTVNFWTMIFLILSIADFITPIIRRGLYFKVDAQIGNILRARSFEAMLRQEISFFDRPENGVGSLAAKLASEVDRIGPCVGGSRFGLIIQALGGFGVGIVLGFMNAWQVTLLALACVPFLTIGIFWELKSNDTIADESAEAHEQACKFATDTLKNIRTVTLLGLQETFINLFEEQTQQPFINNLKIAAKASLGVGFKEAMEFASYGATFYYASRFVLDGTRTPNQVVIALFVVLYSSNSIGWMYYAIPAFARGHTAARSVFKIIDRKPAISNNKNNNNNSNQPFPSQVTNMKFSGVHFSYPLRPEVPVLNGIDFESLRGKTVAIVGASGSGKSTIVSLLMRLYDATRGTITVEGHKIQDWDVTQLREHMALVGQEPSLFSGTIADNIAYGARSNDYVVLRDEIHAAAKMANIHEFVESLPDGYDTVLGESVGVSGGQKQRIAIARALIRKPDVLLLDEATSALDSASERVVENALKEASAGRTVISIAHRLSTIQGADLIIVMTSGNIVESGTHGELMDKGGVYSSMIASQAGEAVRAA
ncbi:P-loop containing nucleoside triphosphate hydrolase protein [Chytriomyces cf. hyalinus JEL632]|nr:P-loop containing nucleoside triphosphate hydrolase protein [Chytriomyces cf. hyalinus JEL632]